MLDACMRSDTTRKRRTGLLLNRTQFREHMFETRRCTKTAQVNVLWKKYLRDRSVTKTKEDGRTCIVLRRPTELQEDEEYTKSKGMESGKVDTAQESTKTLLHKALTHLPRKRKLDEESTPRRPKSVSAASECASSAPKKRQPTKEEKEKASLSRIKYLATQTSSKEAKLALEKREQRQIVKSAQDRFKVLSPSSSSPS